MPQQQRKAHWLALPAQRGEETSGHVELSYVLTCPSSPSLLPSLFAREGETVNGYTEKKSIYYAAALPCHLVQKKLKVVGSS